MVPVQPQNAPPAASRFIGAGHGALNPLVYKELHYVPTEQLILPAGPAGLNDGFSASYGTGALYGLVRNFQDLNGDGRVDFVTLNANGTNPILAINRPSSAGDDYSTLDVPGIADYIYFGTRGALVDGTPLSHPALSDADL